MRRLKAIFMGTPDFSIPALEILFNHPLIELICIVTMPDRPAGRGKKILSPPVAKFALENKIKIIQTENINKEENFAELAENNEIDLIIVLAFAQFLGKKILSLPKLGCFNIHTSLLPKYRGAAPIQYALLNGDTSTGVSIQKMVKKMDAGDLCHSFELKISHEETGGQLYTRLKFQAALSLNEFIHDLHANTVSFSSQDEENVSFAPTLKKDDGKLDLSKHSFQEIQNCLRAFDPWPGVFTFLNNKRLKIFKIEIYNKKLDPGHLSTEFGQLIVGINNASIRLLEVQLEGKKRCSDTELLNGLQNQKEQIKLTFEE